MDTNCAERNADDCFEGGMSNGENEMQSHAVQMPSSAAMTCEESVTLFANLEAS